MTLGKQFDLSEPQLSLWQKGDANSSFQVAGPNRCLYVVAVRGSHPRAPDSGAAALAGVPGVSGTEAHHPSSGRILPNSSWLGWTSMAGRRAGRRGLGRGAGSLVIGLSHLQTINVNSGRPCQTYLPGCKCSLYLPAPFIKTTTEPRQINKTIKCK